MKELKFNKKTVGEIEIKYEGEKNYIVILEAKLNGEIFFEGKRRLSFVKRNNIEYIGFQIFNEEYEIFSNISKINRNDTKAFISFPKEAEQIMRKELNALKYKEEIQEAKEKGEMVQINLGMVACNDPNEECNWDYLTIEVYPDGTVKENRQHTY